MSAKDALPQQSARPAARSAGRRPVAKSYLVRLTLIATLGGLLFGYDTGVISGALLYLRKDLGLSSLGEGVVVSSLLFGAMFGALFGGRVADLIGRRRGLMVCGILFLIGALGSALAPNVGFMIVARVLLGLAVGSASVTVPLFLAELAPAGRRGRIVTINELMIVSGQLLAFIVNSVINATIGGDHVWRWMLGVATVPAVLLLLGISILPESPRWFALRGRFDEARGVLERTRPVDEADQEYEAIVAAVRTQSAGVARQAMRMIRENAWVRRLLLIGCGLAIIQQASGVNTIVYYGTTILESSGLGASASIVATVSLGLVAVIGCLLGIYLLGRFNRRPLLIIGTSGVAASHVVLALAFLLPPSTAVSYLILAAMLLFMLFVQTFAGPLIWLMLSEIFPMAIRGFAMGMAVFLLWTVNALISLVFPIMAEGLGSTATFLIFAVINVGSLIFVIKAVPETRGRSLEELETSFREHGTHITELAAA